MESATDDDDTLKPAVSQFQPESSKDGQMKTEIEVEINV
jgi:hypothetical protein